MRKLPYQLSKSAALLQGQLKHFQRLLPSELFKFTNRELIINNPDPLGQVNTELSNIDRFLHAQAAAKSKNPIEWETLSGIRTFSGFVGCSYSKARSLIKIGRVLSYKIGNIYFFLL